MRFMCTQISSAKFANFDRAQKHRGDVGRNTPGGGRGPVAPPVFKTGLAAIAVAGGFDSLPSPPKNPFKFGLFLCQQNPRSSHEPDFDRLAAC